MKLSIWAISSTVLASAFLSSNVHASQCRNVSAVIDSHMDTANCPSVCTIGNFTGTDLFTSGTSRFVVWTLDSSAPIWTYTGQFELTTSRGTLFITSTGAIDFTTTPPTYFETEVVTGGTRDFLRASGSLMSFGTFDGYAFAGTITGEVCQGYGLLH